MLTSIRATKIHEMFIFGTGEGRRVKGLFLAYRYSLFKVLQKGHRTIAGLENSSQLSYLMLLQFTVYELKRYL